MINLETQIGALQLKNPVITASGTFGYGLEFDPFCDISEIGAIVVKGLTLNPKQGNKPPRLAETPAGLLNSIGLENIGIDFFIKEKLPVLREYGATVIANISATSIDDFIILTEKASEAKGIGAIEVNISCPNVSKGGMQFGTDPEATAKVTEAVVKHSKIPVIMKLSPNVTNISEFARICEDKGATSISLINTLLGMAIDVRSKRPVLGNLFGGLSGPAVKPVALRMVWQVTDAVKIPVIGMGGIMNAEDAIEFFLAGASAISVGTVNMINPSAAIEVSNGIKKYLEDNNFQSLNEIIGLAKINHQAGK